MFNFYEPGDAKRFHHRCIVREIEPRKRFVHTWTHPDRSDAETVVTWTLDEVNGKTRVTLTHEGIGKLAGAGPEFARENYQMGWDGFMYALKNYVYGIRKHTYRVEIDAPAAKVWEAMWSDAGYRQWTAPFSAGSYMKGNLTPGGRVLFLNPENNGVFVDVHFFEPGYAMFQHMGEIRNLEEQPVTEETEKWNGTFETYRLVEEDGKTEVLAEVDFAPEQLAFYNDKFPNALQVLKTIVEGEA